MTLSGAQTLTPHPPDPQEAGARRDYRDVIARLEAVPHMLKGKIPTALVPQTLIAPYQIKVIFHTGEYALGGRNSINCNNQVRVFGDAGQERPAIVIGHHVETAKGVVFLAGGEHRNDRAMNVSFRHFVDIKQIWQKQGVDFQGCFSRGETRIGDAVVIGTNAIIRSGVTLGTGAVIGAGAVVTRDVPPFAIVAGNPAKLIRHRFDEATIADLLKIRWWDFRLGFLTNNIREICELPKPELRQKYLNLPPEVYESGAENRIVFQQIGGEDSGRIDVIGAEVAGKFIARQDLPAEFRFFLDQFQNTPDDITYFIKDIFALSGLTGKM